MGGLMAKGQDGEKQEQLEPGMYPAACHRYYDLGTHHEDYFYEGKHIVGDKKKVLISWEFPDERIEITKDGETLDLPRVQSKEYNLVLGELANLRKDLKSWRGRDFTPQELEGFSLDKILGVNAMITIIHNDKGKAKIAGVGPLVKNMKKRKPENEVFGWSFDNDGPDQLPDDTPSWIRDKIEASLEWQALDNKATGTYEPDQNEEGEYSSPPDDDLPF